MTREQQGGSPASGEGGRRFRVTRRVKRGAPPIETREEREMRELAEMGEDADRGTPEQDASLRSGCTSLIWVVGLFFVVMIGSILVTMVSR